MARRPTIAKSTKTNAGCAADRVQLATYPQSPRAGALLRRNGPVGILAAHRPGAIMDKSRRRFVIRLDALWGSTRKAPTKTSITLPFQDSSRKNKNSNHRSAEDAKFGMDLGLVSGLMV